MKVSAIIVVKGKPEYLFDTLHSIEDFVSEIIIGDIGIDPDIRSKLEKSSRNQIINLDKQTSHVELVREVLKEKTKEEFILYMDPDEIFPNDAKNILLEKSQNYDCFYFPRKNFIFKKWIKHSRWWPDYQLRFFRKNSVKWPTQIHVQPFVKGNIYKFEEDEKYAILHHNYEDLDEFMAKMPRYAKAQALEYTTNNTDFTLRTAVKKGISEFISRFFAESGHKDGMHGFVLAFLQMFYYFLVYFYYWESKKYPDVNMGELVDSADDYFKQGLYETKFWKDKTKLGSPLEKMKMKIIKRL